MSRTFMTVRTLARSAFAVIFTAAAFVVMEHACEAQAKNGDTSPIRRLLVDAWTLSSESRQTVDDVLQNNALTESDADLPFAAVLVLIKQSRLDEALRQVQALTGAYPDHVDALWSECWLLTARRNYSAALLRMQSLGDWISGQRAAAASDAAPRPAEHGLSLARLAEDLGRAMGYLEGPVHDAVNASELERTIRHLTTGLDAESRTMFEQGRLQVSEAFARRQAEIQQVSDQQRQSDDERRAVARASLQQEQVSIADQLGRAEQNLRQLELTFSERRAELEQQRSNIAIDAGTLAGDVESRRSDLFFSSNQIGQIELLLETEQDPVQRSLLLARLNELIRIQHYQIADVRVAENNLSRMQTQLAQVHAAQQSLQQSFDRDRARVNRERQGVEKRQRQTARQLQDLSTISSRSPAQIRSLQQRATSLQTYVPLPLDAYRQAILTRQ